MTFPQSLSSLIAPLLLSSMACGLASAQRGPAAADALGSWRAQHGASWSTYTDRDTGQVELLYGGKLEASFSPRNDTDWFLRARLALQEARALTQVDAATLFERQVLTIPLAHLGTSDKVSVSFQQRIDGVAVDGARMDLLFDADGGLLSVHSTALAGEALHVAPARQTAAAASLRAREIFTQRKGLSATRVSAPQLSILPLRQGSGHVPILAWRVELFWEQGGVPPEGEALWIDASTGQLLHTTNLIHQLDVSGTITAMATPGTAPDTGSNPEQVHPLAHLLLESSAGQAITDAAGHFNFVGASGPLQVTSAFMGSFARIFNVAGSDHSIDSVFSTGAGNDVLLNPSSQDLITAQANAFYGINLLRDWIRSINPGDGHADFPAAAYVNINQSCNAFFDGSSVNFFTPGGNCPNTAYSSVIAHEMGHWLNVRYATGNGPDGMGEGNADTWAMYLYDTPLVGEGFSGGGALRSGLNNLQFCGDFNPACHGGQVHQQGKVWMGAAWKVRDQLNQALGNALGDDLANALFLGWMASFNQTEIKSVIEVQWLLLDDDDGNLNNGSPHYVPIEAGFAQQGWPGLALNPITIEEVSVPADSEQERGPYDASLTITPHMGQSLVSAQVHYRVNGAAWQAMDLLPLPDDRYASLLPDVSSPAVVELWFSASDSLGNSLSWPTGGASEPVSFAVGEVTAFISESFEGGTSGWTHASYGDTASALDDWEHGPTAGQDGIAFEGTVPIQWSDPGAAASGSALWGTDLGGSGDGRHGNQVHSWLRSPAYDCTGRTGTRLRFKRWASVHRTDELSVRVNGALVWTSGDLGDLLDQAWKDIELDISSYADGSPAVVIEFEMRSNGNLRLGGWQLDDVELAAFGASSGACVAPSSYGPAKPSSTYAIPTLQASGSPVPGGGFRIQVTEAAVVQPAFLFSGPSWAQVPFAGAYRLVSGPIVREGTATTNGLGSAEYDIDVNAAMLGTTRYYQVWFRDPGLLDGTGIGLSTGLRVQHCP